MANPNWKKGVSGNPAGRTKTAYLEDFDTIRAKREMMGEATQILRERWQEVINAMIDHAIKGNPQAAAFVANYVLGKPKETVELDTSLQNKMKITIEKVEDNI